MTNLDRDAPAPEHLWSGPTFQPDYPRKSQTKNIRSVLGYLENSGAPIFWG